MRPTPKFSSEHILLRPFTKEDSPPLHAALNHPELTARRYIPWEFDDELPLSLEQTEKVIEKWLEMEEGFAYAVVRQGDQTLVGHTVTRWDWDPHMPDIAAVIYPEAQRQGLGTQALTIALDYLFNFTIAHNVSNGIEEWNTPAISFAEKMGFTRVGVLRRETYRGGKFYDDIILDILRPEWKERRHAA
jgi:RimJ/RimL family protein N-acetyltransferase